MLLHSQILALAGVKDQEHPSLRRTMVPPAMGQGGIEQEIVARRQPIFLAIDLVCDESLQAIGPFGTRVLDGRSLTAGIRFHGDQERSKCMIG